MPANILSPQRHGDTEEARISRKYTQIHANGWLPFHLRLFACIRSLFGLYALVYMVALVVYALVAWPHTHPPYMDAFYYVDIARSLAHGHGFVEGFVWNYLGDVPPLRHPSSEYWLPGLSLLLTPAFLLGGGYHVAALLTCAVAALCPTLAAVIGWDTFRTRRHALTMAALTLFNGVWFHDWATPDAFVLYAALATLALLLCARGLQGRGPGAGALLFALSGLVAGGAALTRQEGVLLLVAVLLAALATPAARRRLWPHGIAGAVALFGLAELPWLAHNMVALGRLTAAGGSRTLWMRSYDQFYALHTEALNPSAYLQWGWAHIIGTRVDAALFTLETWAALWLVVLLPPLLAGLWRMWRGVEFRPFLIYWALLALAMPLLFAATLRNGTLAHASGALLPFASGLIVAGVDVLARGLARLRGRDPARLARVMGAIAVALAAFVSLYMTMATFPAHGDEYTRDARVVSWLHRHNASKAPVMVVDPPAFAYIDHGPYVVAPSDGMAAARAVARRYGVRYWAIDPIHAGYQEGLYRSGRSPVSWLEPVAMIDGVRLYRVLPDKGARRA